MGLLQKGAKTMICNTSPLPLLFPPPNAGRRSSQQATKTPRWTLVNFEVAIWHDLRATGRAVHVTTGWEECVCVWGGGAALTIGYFWVPRRRILLLLVVLPMNACWPCQVVATHRQGGWVVVDVCVLMRSTPGPSWPHWTFEAPRWTRPWRQLTLLLASWQY